ncbi:uncharacterized protein [Dendropsophus ebraccatus]|uniref:uncharacterized protein n=1 Tax=Dendropsophus ebraccatus TaxID=150705 RepID=UPI00383163FE
MEKDSWKKTSMRKPPRWMQNILHAALLIIIYTLSGVCADGSQSATEVQASQENRGAQENLPGQTQDASQVLKTVPESEESIDDVWIDDLQEEMFVDTSRDIGGKICVGYGVRCCVEIYFAHNTTIDIDMKAGPKKRTYTQLQGTYVHNRQLGKWECMPNEMSFWYIEIQGHEPASWTGDVTNFKLSTKQSGKNRDDLSYRSQLFATFLNPNRITNKDTDEDWSEGWVFQVARANVYVQVNVQLTVTNNIAPEIRVISQNTTIQEGIDPLRLQCGTRLPLPIDAVIKWSREGKILGSYTNGFPGLLHKGEYGDVRWAGNLFNFYIASPLRKDSGQYECCVTTGRSYKNCNSTFVRVWAPEDNACTNVMFKLSDPFQVNHFQTKPLLRNGVFVTLVWTFNITNWMISSRFPQCKPYLSNSEMGLSQWFGQNSPKTLKSKRGVVEGVLGGFGTLGSLANTMDINTLQADLKTIGYLGKRGVQVQKDVNQLLEHMVMSIATVLGSSVSHLQDATLGLIESQEETKVSRACLEIQIEFSTNLKMIAQAMQGGIIPLGVLKSLPEQYGFGLGHLDLWINKWGGCEQNVCVGTSLIPVAGLDQVLVPVVSLGIPVSSKQVIYYELQYTDFAFDGNKLEQLDISACFHFESKVMCLPGQDKVIYHSCFHNHTACKARIETVDSGKDLMTQVKVNEICFQVMEEQMLARAFYSNCAHVRNLSRGLYCIEGDIKYLEVNKNRYNVSSITTEYLRPLPVQFNLTQIDHFPWEEWTNEIKKDKGLLNLLNQQLKTAEIVFQHQQGQLNQIQHEWDEMAGSRWWKNLKKSVDMWSESSTQKAVFNILTHPIVIIAIIVFLCVLYQLFVLWKVRKVYKKIKVEVDKGDNFLRDMIKRMQYSNSNLNLNKKPVCAEDSDMVMKNKGYA